MTLFTIRAFKPAEASAQLLPSTLDDVTADIDAEAPDYLWDVFSLPAEMWFVDEIDEDIDPDLPDVAGDLAAYAAQFLGRRYVFGATGPKAFDCSGFTSHVFKQAGIELNRTSRMQYTQGEAIAHSDIQPGDLMFFSSPRSGKGKVGHVAMVVDVDKDNNECTFIHASSSKGVTYQKFPDNGYFSRNYIGAKRVIG